MIGRPGIFDDEHLPQRLLHREAETKQLLDALDPGVDHTRHGYAMVSGPSGVGKTVLTRYCCRELAQERSLDHAHVRCLGATTGTILRSIIEDLRSGPNDLSHNQPLDDTLETLHTAVDGSVVVVLDEADDVPDDAVEILSEMRQVSIAMICHQPAEWYSAATPTVRERLKAGTEIQLKRYRTAELADILTKRAEAGLSGNVWTRHQLEYIADEVAGVARNGIQSLRAAAELAAERGHETLQRTDIDDGFGRAQTEIRRANLRSLPFEHQFLYELIRQHGRNNGITSGALYQRYDECADDIWEGRPSTPPTKRTRRDHLEKLRQYDLITTEERVHYAIDQSLEPSVSLSLELLAE